MSKETTETTKKELSYVGINELRPSRYNMFATDQYKDLKESIRAVGLLTPLTVIGTPGAYDILSGERRFRAISDLHKEDASLFEKVPVYIIGKEDMNTTKQKVIIEVANLETRGEADYNVHDHRFRLMRLIREMASSPEEEDKMVADVFKNNMKLSSRYKNMYKNVFDNGIEELVSIVTDSKTHVPLAEASNLAELSEEGQKEAVERVKNGEKAKDVYNDLAVAEGKKKPEPKPEETEMPSFDSSDLDDREYGSYDEPAEDTYNDSDPYDEETYDDPHDDDPYENPVSEAYDDDEEEADAGELLRKFNELVDEECGTEQSNGDSGLENVFGKHYQEEDYIPDAPAVKRWMDKIMKKSRSDFDPFEEEVYELAEKWVARKGWLPDDSDNNVEN